MPDRFAVRAAGTLLAAGAGLAVWATAVEPRRLAVRRRDLALPNWPPGLDGLRVVVLSDLHAGGPHVDVERVGRIVDRARELGPDLALLLGDFVDPEVILGGRVAPEDVAGQLARLAPPLGAFAVLGNHDWGDDGPRIWAALGARGIEVLENRAVEVGRGARRLWIAGVGDATTRRPDFDEALSAIPPGAPVLLLSHDPDVFPEVPARVALTLAGHTHGGQVDLPGVKRRAIPSRFGDRYARGVIEEGGRLLFVTSGVGQSRAPVRLRRPPEVVLLTLGSGRARGRPSRWRRAR